MIPIRLALVDMDGTLLGSDQVVISDRNMRALEALHREGCEVVPCTGRVVDMLPPQLLEAPFIRYVVSCHGARVYDRATGGSIYEDILTPEDSARVLRAFEGLGLYAEVAANHTIYVEENVEKNLLTCPPVPPHHMWYMHRDRLFTVFPCLSEAFVAQGIGIEKVNIYGIPEELQQQVFDQVGATGVIRHTRGTAAKDLEFSPKHMDKGRAMDALLRHLGLTYEDTFAIGDSSTDADVIRLSRIGIAMGNSPDNIKALANAVTGRNTEDGFAQAVEQYVLSEVNA